MNGLRLTLLFFLVLVAGCATNETRTAGADKPAVHTAYTRLGIEYLQARDLQGAKNAFQKALEIAPDDGEAYNGLALTFQIEGEAELAEEYFRKATRYAPQSAMIHNNFGAFLFSAQRYEEACKELARATEDPFYNRRSQAFENLGRCYRLLDKSEAAQHAFSRALQISPSRMISMIELADLFIAQGKYDEAESLFERFSALVDAKRVEHYAGSLWVGIRLARHSGRSSQAATYALILKNLFPDSAEYRMYEESHGE